MNRIHQCIAISFSFLAAAASSHAALEAYWDMDEAANFSDKGTANAGAQAGAVSPAEFKRVDLGILSFTNKTATGTADNAVIVNSPNYAAGFFDGASIYDDITFEMTGFDFTGLSGIEVSFAYRAENVFSLSDHLRVEWRINSTANVWNFISLDEVTTGNYQVTSAYLSPWVDNSDDVDIRITTNSWLSAIGRFDLDNVQVNSGVIPEPQTIGLILGLSVLGLAIVRRKFTGLQ